MIFSASAPTFVPFRDLKLLHDKLNRAHAYHAQASLEYWLVYSSTKKYITSPIYRELFLNASYSLRQTEFAIMFAENASGLNTFENDYQAAFLLNRTRSYLDPEVKFDKKKFSLFEEISLMCSLLHDTDPPKHPQLSGLVERLAVCIHALNRVIKCVTYN